MDGKVGIAAGQGMFGNIQTLDLILLGDPQAHRGLHGQEHQEDRPGNPGDDGVDLVGADSADLAGFGSHGSRDTVQEAELEGSEVNTGDVRFLTGLG